MQLWLCHHLESSFSIRTPPCNTRARLFWLSDVCFDVFWFSSITSMGGGRGLVIAFHLNTRKLSLSLCLHMGACVLAEWADTRWFLGNFCNSWTRTWIKIKNQNPNKSNKTSSSYSTQNQLWLMHKVHARSSVGLILLYCWENPAPLRQHLLWDTW